MNIRNTATALLFAAGIMFATPFVSQAQDTTLFMPLVSSCQPSNAPAFSQPWHRDAMLPLAYDVTLDVKFAKSEGDALKFVDNQTFVIKDKENITGTGNIDVHPVNIDFSSFVTSKVVKIAAYGYTYHTKTKDEPQVVIRAYIKTDDGRFMTLASEAHYTAIDPALPVEDQYSDAVMMIVQMVDLYAPDADLYFTHSINQ